ncbi:MAG: hypothetical protein OXC05_05820 [Halieaceae bacterium]|nr:hypothetical protein [Halieaceae bacterium]
MNILHTDWWSLALPPEWLAEREEDGIVIADQDGVGSIEITTLRRESGEFTVAELRRIAGNDDCCFDPVQMGDFRGLGRTFQEADTALREWYLAAGGLLLFITYSCGLEQARLDDAAVDAILDTLQLSSTGADFSSCE